MKKIIFSLLILFGIILGFSSCSSCSSEKKNEIIKEKANKSLVVENLISTDREAMFLKFGENYRWFETCIRLPEFLDSEDVTSDPVMVVNIFQSIIEEGNGADIYVWKFQHFADGTVDVDSIHGFWIEDTALNEDSFKLTYKEAFERMMESSLPKPHSKNAILRNPIGPVAVNPQWVFGNISEQIWVDVITGDAKSSNPAFPKEKGFKMPLGEWP